MTISHSSNPNIRWAATFVAELAASGLTAACIAPGSRSTPLTLAFSAHPRVQVYHHIDERCAAFFALGLAMSTDTLVALVCTSGTATANFHPAIIEAHQSMIPLLVLTGDRPHELRHSGANQTIDQVKMFGDHVLWSVDMGLPELDAPAVALHNARSTAARAFATANGSTNGLRKGPVHINFPFRKPLEPVNPQESIFEENELGSRPRTTIQSGVLSPTAKQLSDLVALIEEHDRGLIVFGPRRSPRDEDQGEFARLLCELSEQCGYPILADPLSGLRFGVAYGDATFSQRIISTYETFLAAGANAQPFDPPEVIIRFGAVPTSKWLNAYLDEISPTHRIHIRENGVWADDSHRTTFFLQANEFETCLRLHQRTISRKNRGWENQVLKAEHKCRVATYSAMENANFDGAAIYELARLMPENARLFVGNSLPIRHLDQFCPAVDYPLEVYGNRGASGIDGTVSCALGVAASGTHPLVLVLGDVTLAHDLNGLLAIGQVDAPVTIVLINNGGGGIFRRLPIAKFEPPFEELFVTPHSLDFGSIVQGYGWDFVSVDSRHDFRNAFAGMDQSERKLVIEVRTDGAADLVERARVLAEINHANNYCVTA